MEILASLELTMWRLKVRLHDIKINHDITKSLDPKPGWNGNNDFIKISISDNDSKCKIENLFVQFSTDTDNEMLKR